jgi:hypothetical protein
MSSHPAQALTIFPQTGPSKDYVRVDDDGRTAWCLATRQAEQRPTQRRAVPGGTGQLLDAPSAPGASAMGADTAGPVRR